MMTEPKPLQNFNLETMSGIYPGSRTMTYQRLRLRDPEGEVAGWAQLQWYSEPSAVRLWQLHQGRPATEPLITLDEPEQANFLPRLHDALNRLDRRADACFACQHWRAANVNTVDGLPAGRCSWRDNEAHLPAAIAMQSALSLACAHFQHIDQAQVSQPTHATVGISHPRVLKSAELDPDRLPFWPRLWHRVRYGVQKYTQRVPDDILERSGVGAGTEPCFVCHGRLANLGALAVASPEGDKQTFSVWRCRSCYTTYFNDWTDKWERLENLETEERYFRIAPAESYAALQIILATKGGEHPGRRRDRDDERAQMLAIVADKKPLSHQVRQGR